MALAGVVLDYLGWRRYALWPHVFGLYGCAWALCDLLGYSAPAFLIPGGVIVALGVWLGRRSHLVIGGLIAATGIGALSQGEHLGTVLVLAGGAILVAAYALATVDTPLRRFMLARTLPAPARDS